MSRFDSVIFSFKSEKDLREWVRLALGDEVSWVEPAFGSTPGLPDLMLHLRGGGVIFVELKLASFINAKQDLVEYSLTPEQRHQIPLIMAKGSVVCILVAVKNTADIFLVECKTNYILKSERFDIGNGIDHPWFIDRRKPETLRPKLVDFNCVNEYGLI